MTLKCRLIMSFPGLAGFISNHRDEDIEALIDRFIVHLDTSCRPC